MIEPKRTLPPNKPHRTPAWVWAVGLGSVVFFLGLGAFVGFLSARAKMHRAHAIHSTVD